MVVIIVVTIYKEYFHLLWRVCRPCRKRRPCCCWVPSFSPQLSSAADQCSPLNCCSKEFSEVWNTVNTDISIFRIQCFLKLSAMWKCVAQELQYAMRRAGQNPTDVEVRDGLNFSFKSICQHLDLGERDNSAFSPFFFANATSCVCNLWITRWITCFSKLDSFRIHSSQCKLIDSGSFAGSRYDQQDWRWLRHARLQGNFFVFSSLSLLQDFCFVIKEKTREMDTETHFKVLTIFHFHFNIEKCGLKMMCHPKQTET